VKFGKIEVCPEAQLLIHENVLVSTIEVQCVFKILKGSVVMTSVLRNIDEI